MVYVIYLILAAGVVLCSGLAAKYVDLLDQKTSLSGAFLGGIMLSAVTSLPELFTSLSSTLMLHEPGLCLGNIMGSDMFNSFLLAVLIYVFYRSYRPKLLAKSHTVTSLLVVLCFVAVALHRFHLLDVTIGWFSLTSAIILILYAIGIRFLGMDNGSEELPAEEKHEKEIISEAITSRLAVKAIVIRLALAGIGIIVLSIFLTYATDKIAIQLDLGKGFAGALLLGVATSLPELTSTFALFKIGNHNIAVGNIVGSNLFNFSILSLCDFFYFRSGLYTSSDTGTQYLIIFGGVQALMMLLMLQWKNKATKLLCPAVIIGCYIAFLLM